MSDTLNLLREGISQRVGAICRNEQAANSGFAPELLAISKMEDNAEALHALCRDARILLSPAGVADGAKAALVAAGAAPSGSREEAIAHLIYAAKNAVLWFEPPQYADAAAATAEFLREAVEGVCIRPRDPASPCATSQDVPAPSVYPQAREVMGTGGSSAREEALEKALRALYEVALSGQFYEDYDQSNELLGEASAALALPSTPALPRDGERVGELIAKLHELQHRWRADEAKLRRKDHEVCVADALSDHDKANGIAICADDMRDLLARLPLPTPHQEAVAGAAGVPEGWRWLSAGERTALTDVCEDGAPYPYSGILVREIDTRTPHRIRRRIQPEGAPAQQA